MTPIQLYHKLYSLYGPQGWWPLLKPSQQGYQAVYEPGKDPLPASPADQLEICLGAILTQNTAWHNVLLALANLKALGELNPARLLALEHHQLAQLVRPAGYFNQKAGYLRNFLLAIQPLGLTGLMQMPQAEARRFLLDIKGIGPETADGMLLYALGHPEFVVDAYSHRIVTHLGLLTMEKYSYKDLKAWFQGQLQPDLLVFQEFHALLVRHGVQYYSKKPLGQGDPLLTFS